MKAVQGIFLKGMRWNKNTLALLELFELREDIIFLFKWFWLERKSFMFDIRIFAFMDLIQKVDIESPQEPEVVDMIFQSVFLHSR